MPAREREHGELPSPTFVPVGRKAGGHACFSLAALKGKNGGGQTRRRPGNGGGLEGGFG